MPEPAEARYVEAGVEEDATFQLLDLRLQLNELDAENLRLRKQLEHQCGSVMVAQLAVIVGGIR